MVRYNNNYNLRGGGAILPENLVAAANIALIDKLKTDSNLTHFIDYIMGGEVVVKGHHKEIIAEAMNVSGLGLDVRDEPLLAESLRKTELDQQPEQITKQIFIMLVYLLSKGWREDVQFNFKRGDEESGGKVLQISAGTGKYLFSIDDGNRPHPPFYNLANIVFNGGTAPEKLVSERGAIEVGDNFVIARTNGGSRRRRRRSSRRRRRRSSKKRKGSCANKRRSRSCRRSKRCSWTKRSKRSKGHCRRSKNRK